MKIKIGIIMPVKDQQDFVMQTTRSIVTQDIDFNKYSVTLLLINDGSTDESIERIKLVLDKSNINLELIQGGGLKPAWARNLALKEWKRFDYFAFLDSDDVWQPYHLKQSMNYLEELKCDLVYSDVQGIYENYQPTQLTGVPNPKYFSLEIMERTNYIYISTVVMKASCAQYDKMSKWAEPFPDWEYWHRLCKKYHVHHIENQSVYYMWKRTEGSWTYYRAEEAEKCNQKIVEWREFNWPQRVDGWMSQTELDTLREAARGKRVLELGAYKGKSTCAMALDAISVHSVDTFGCSMDGQTQMDALTTLDAFKTNTDRFGNVTYSIGFTTEVLPTLKDGAYDFIFIDAMHDYNSVLADLTLAASKIGSFENEQKTIKTGRIGFHDFHNPDYPGVKKAVSDWLSLQGVNPDEWFSTKSESHDSILIMDVPLGATGQFIPEIVEASESSNIDSQVFMFDNNSNEKQTYDSIIESVKDADKIWKFKGSVLIAPFAVRLPDGSVNPKSPPISYWTPIVEKLKTLGYQVIHVSGYDEPNINANKTIVRPSMDELEQLINKCTFFICVDTFLQHMANFLNKKGIVLWSQSDPKIFGYQENINLYKDSKYFRHHQFQMWTQTPYMEEAFPTQQDVIDHCVGFHDFLV